VFIVCAAGIINTNMWGMPMVGADICGFADMAFKEGGSPDMISEDSLRELCNRWDEAKQLLCQ
jgi:alpha-glucosidase (family GH31 glycosyl hydrolase)